MYRGRSCRILRVDKSAVLAVAEGRPYLVIRGNNYQRPLICNHDKLHKHLAMYLENRSRTVPKP